MLNGTVRHFYSTSREKTSRRVEDVRMIKLILGKYRVSEKSLCNCARRVVGSSMHATI